MDSTDRDATDRDALVALYCSTGGTNWAHNVGWNTDAELSTWYGVQLNDQGRVVSLSLSANNLKGHIPKEFGDLSHLETLSLEENQLSGHIPKELGNLSHLRILSLRENQLSGPIPEEIGALSELKNLWLSGNQLSGHIPNELGSLRHLEMLSLWENQLTGYIPSGLGALSHLRILSLRENQLSGSIPEERYAVPHLWLSGNQFSGWSKAYYHNHHDKIATSDRPVLVEEPNGAGAGGMEKNGGRGREKKPPAQASGTAEKQQPLPPGWSKAYTKTGEVYYRNQHDKTTTWDRPVLVEEPNGAGAGGMEKNGGRGGEKKPPAQTSGTAEKEQPLPSGHIPAVFGSLSQLVELLWANQLSGPYSIPKKELMELGVLGDDPLRERFGGYLNDLHALKGFESDWDAAEKEIEEAAGPDRPASDTMMPHSLGNSPEAEPLNARSQAFYEKSLGSEHPDMATALNNQALLLSGQGEFTEAEMLYAQSQTIYEKSLGSEHPLVATALSNRANLLNKQGMYAEAEPLYERSQTIIEKALGPEHPLVATTLSANLLSKQGMYAEAEPLSERSQTIIEKALGPEHPLVATTLSANLLSKQDMYAEAEPLYERSQTIFEKALGSEHPLVATTLSAYLLSKQGKYEEADPLYLRAIEIGEKTLGTFLNDQGVLMGTQRSQMPDEELLSPLKKDRIILDILDKFVASPETDKTHESFTGQPALTGDTWDETGAAFDSFVLDFFLNSFVLMMWVIVRYMRKVLQHRSSSSYIHRTAEVANRKGSATRSSTMLGILAATVFMPGVAAAETYGGIIDLVMYARERWCNVHVSLHVVAVILTGICLFKSVIFAIGEIKAGLAELAEALQEARQAKHAIARPQHHAASRARSKA